MHGVPYARVCSTPGSVAVSASTRSYASASAPVGTNFNGAGSPPRFVDRFRVRPVAFGAGCSAFGLRRGLGRSFARCHELAYLPICERSAGCERGRVESLAHPLIAGAVRVQIVRQIGRVGGAEQLEPVEIMQVCIARLAAAFDDVADDRAHLLQRQAAVADLVVSRQRDELAARVRNRRAGALFRRRAEDRRRDQKRRIRLAFADGVDEAVQRRRERALLQRIRSSPR